MLALLAPRVLRASAGRRAGLGLDEAQLERGRELSVQALSAARDSSDATCSGRGTTRDSPPPVSSASTSCIIWH